MKTKVSSLYYTQPRHELDISLVDNKGLHI